MAQRQTKPAAINNNRTSTNAATEQPKVSELRDAVAAGSRAMRLGGADGH